MFVVVVVCVVLCVCLLFDVFCCFALCVCSVGVSCVFVMCILFNSFRRSFVEAVRILKRKLNRRWLGVVGSFCFA